MAFAKMGAGFGRMLNPLGRAGGLGPRSYTYPYPTFPSTTLARFRSAADFSASGTIPTDTSTTGSPYGNATAPQFNFGSGGWNTFQAALTSAGPIDARNASIRINLRPVSNAFALSIFNIFLYSTTNPASPGPNHSVINSAGRVGQQWTGNNNGVPADGRWQQISFPITAAAISGGTGADLSSLRMARVSGTNACGFQLGDIEVVPNPRTKGAVIIRADDASLHQYTDLFPTMAAWGAQGVLMPSPLNNTVGVNPTFFLTYAQWNEMMTAGWQSASQGFTTEDVNTIDAWARQQRLAEWAGPRAFMTQHGLPDHLTDTDDGSYMSNFGAKDMIAGQDFRDSFRSGCSFFNGAGSGVPFSVSETFPPGDRYNITCLNISSWGDVTDIYLNHLLLALEQTRACKGLLIIAGHGEWNTANVISALNSVGDYVVNQFPSEMEFTTLRKLWAPYNGDPIVTPPAYTPTFELLGF